MKHTAREIVADGVAAVLIAVVVLGILYGYLRIHEEMDKAKDGCVDKGGVWLDDHCHVPVPHDGR